MKTSKYSRAIAAHYKVTALDVSVAKELAGKLQNLETFKQQTYLEKFVVNEGIRGDDLLELMYDLHKEGFTNLKKPTIQGQPKFSNNPMISKIEKGEIDTELGSMLSNAEDHELDTVIKYFESHEDKYGKFINDAEENAIGFYENDLGIKITKKVLEHVNNDYLIHSILYSSVYGTKNVTNDAIEYAYTRFKNPFRTVLDDHAPPYIFELATDYFTSGSMKAKMKTWFNELTEKEQEAILYDEPEKMSKYLND
jgi:hypothetical protein